MRNRRKPGILDSLIKGLSALSDSNETQEKKINRQRASTTKQGAAVKQCR